MAQQLGFKRSALSVVDSWLDGDDAQDTGAPVAEGPTGVKAMSMRAGRLGLGADPKALQASKVAAVNDANSEAASKRLKGRLKRGRDGDGGRDDDDDDSDGDDAEESRAGAVKGNKHMQRLNHEKKQEAIAVSAASKKAKKAAKEETLAKAAVPVAKAVLSKSKSKSESGTGEDFGLEEADQPLGLRVDKAKAAVGDVAKEKFKRKKTRSKKKNLKKDTRPDDRKPDYYKEGWNHQLASKRGEAGAEQGGDEKKKGRVRWGNKPREAEATKTILNDEEEQ